MWGCPFSPSLPGPWLSAPGLLVGIVVLAAGFLLMRSLLADRSHRHGARADRADALRILRTRLASGDLSQEEFERLRRAVES